VLLSGRDCGADRSNLAQKIPTADLDAICGQGFMKPDAFVQIV
jgi:hypothetical protein